MAKFWYILSQLAARVDYRARFKIYLPIYLVFNINTEYHVIPAIIPTVPAVCVIPPPQTKLPGLDIWYFVTSP